MLTNSKAIVMSALIGFSSSVFAQDELISLNDYVTALKAQITAMEKGAGGDGADVYISPIKVKLQAVVKKSAEGGVEFFVFTADGSYEQALTQSFEFDVSNKPTGDGWRASIEEATGAAGLVTASFGELIKNGLDPQIYSEEHWVKVPPGGFKTNLSDEDIDRIVNGIIEKTNKADQ